MRKRMRNLAVLLTVAMTLGSVGITSHAASKRISSVSIEIESEIQVGEDIPSSEVHVTTKSSHYTVSSVEFTNEGFEWSEDDIPTIEIWLEAESDYYFSVNAKDVKIKGGTYVNGKKDENSQLILTVKLPSLQESAGRIEEAGWEGETMAQWSEAANAGSYEVKLYRDGTNVKQTQTSAANRLDMAPCMTKAGTYNYRVRAVNKLNGDIKSEWMESSDITVSSELAARMREQHGSQTSGLAEPGLDGGAQTAGWVQDHKGWWYRNADGGYTANNWQMIDNLWYYFDGNGYMVTGWIQWKDLWYYCDLAGGHMMTSCLTPDGLRVDSNGVWIQ